MTSKSNSIVSREDFYSRSTSEEKRNAKHLSTQSKCAIIAFVVGGVAGGILIALGAMNMFGPIGSVGFIGSIAGGGILTLFSGGSLIWLIISNCQKGAEGQLEIPASKSEKIADEGASELPEQSGDDDVIFTKFKERLDQSNSVSAALQEIPKDLFENKSQERAKAIFSKTMHELFGAAVSFPQAGSIGNLDHGLNEDLDPNVFQLSKTQGVEKDIPNSSKDERHVHVYQVASQYNAAEAANRYTPAIGTAMQSSKGDHTQGPLAQRTNPAAFECVTAFLTHLGFNMLEKVLPSAGRTYQKGASIEHGYLCPTDEMLEELTREFKENFSQAEYICYSSLSDSWGGSQPVYIMLQSAPAIGYSHKLNSPSDELQKYAAFANYLALFRQGIALAKSTGKPVVLHAAAVGGGVFGNEAINLQWGFYKAAVFLQEEMKAMHVTVQLEAFKGGGPLKEIAENLQIPSKARIGG